MNTTKSIVSRCQVCNRPLKTAASTARNVGPVCEGHLGYVYSPFVIVADSNEQSGQYKFSGMHEDSNRGGAEIIPRIVTKAMYRRGLADYSIHGLEWEIQVERKELGDLFGSVTHRRSQFEQEIARLNDYCQVAYIVVEGQWSDVFAGTERMQSHWDSTRIYKAAKTVSRTMMSWSIKYPRVHWQFCTGRDHAEKFTYRVLEMYWRKVSETT